MKLFPLFRGFLYPIIKLAFVLLLTGCASQKADKSSSFIFEPPQPPEARIEVDISNQLLTLHSADGRMRVYPVSTGKNGAGQRRGSMQTPLGEHVIIEKVGDGLPWNAIYKYGAFTGKYYDRTTQLKKGEDPILSRIIRIAGTEDGYNSGGDVDTENRRIYIHGTPPSERPQDRKPTSHGCIRMDVNHMIDLFQRVDVGTKVVIRDK